MPQRPTPPLAPMRFIVDHATGTVTYPIDFLGEERRRERSPLAAPAPPPLPRAEFDGATPESVAWATRSGSLNDLVSPITGGARFEHCDRLWALEIILVPQPRLHLRVGPGSTDTWDFHDVVLVDSLPAKGVQPGHPPHWLENLSWDGSQHFLIESCCYDLIVRSPRCVLG